MQGLKWESLENVGTKGCFSPKNLQPKKKRKKKEKKKKKKKKKRDE